MYKKLLIVIMFIPVIGFTDTNLDIAKCSKEKDNFSRLACFDKISNYLEETSSITINAKTHEIALKSFEEIGKSLRSIEKLELQKAMEILVYATTKNENIKDFKLSKKFLTMVDGKTITEILDLSRDPKTINLSKKNEEDYLNSSERTITTLSEKESLDMVINGSTEDSYYTSLGKIISHKDISSKFMDAYNLLRGDSKAYYKMIDGLTIGQVISKADRKKQEHQDYLEQVKIYNIKSKYYSTYSDKKVPGVEFKLKNQGNKTLSKIVVTIYFKDKIGNIIAEDSFYPVNVDSIYSQKDALKPNYIWRQERGKFYSAKNVPEEWKTGSVEAKVTKIEFLDVK